MEENNGISNPEVWKADSEEETPASDPLEEKAPAETPEPKETESSPEEAEDGQKPGKSKKPRKKNREKGWRMALRIVITLVIIAAGIFVILWAVAKAAKYETIPDMISHMWGELDLMWKRITA